MGTRTLHTTMRGAIALAWLVAAAAQAGVPEGVSALANRNYDEARRQFEAAGNDAEALYQLAQMAFYGLGEPRDEAKGMALYQRAHEAGSQAAGLAYGRNLVSGAGAPKDEARGMAIIAKLAEAGNARAQYLYGLALELGAWGVAKDEAAGVAWHKRAMDQGNVESLVRYSNALSIGRGVAKDEAKAIEVLKAEVARDTPLVLVAYGRMFVTGRGVEKNEAEGLKHFMRAAERGFADAQWEVGMAHLFGRGTSRDTTEGARWVDAAARNGHSGAQRLYGLLFRDGVGVAQNAVQAYKWLTIAHNNGNSQANQLRAALAGTMTTAQIEDAVRQANLYRYDGTVRVAAKRVELARGDRVELGGNTVRAPLPDGWVNAWEIIEQMRKIAPNFDAGNDTLLVAMASQDIDRIKLGLRVQSWRMLEVGKYSGDEKVKVSPELFAELRKQFRESMEARMKRNDVPQGAAQQYLRDDDRALLMITTRPPTGDRPGSASGFGLLRIADRAMVIRVTGLVGAEDAVKEATALTQEWARLMLNAN